MSGPQIQFILACGITAGEVGPRCPNAPDGVVGWEVRWGHGALPSCSSSECRLKNTEPGWNDFEFGICELEIMV